MLFPHISVVIPTRNRLNTLRTCMDSIFAAEYPRNSLEVVVVDDGSSDETPHYLKQMVAGGYPVRIVRRDGKGPAHARNRGITISSGELIAFTDDDCIVAKDWLLHIATAMADPTIDALGGLVRAAQDHLIGRFMDHIHALDPALSPAGRPRFLITANACFRRSALEQSGGFNETFSTAGGEDIELSLRLLHGGSKFAFVPWCRVLHQYEASATDFLRRFYRYGVGQRNMQRIHPTWELGHTNVERDILACLNGARQLLDTDTITDAADRAWFSLLDALMMIVAFAGYRLIATKSQLLESVSTADSPRLAEESTHQVNQTQAEVVLDTLSSGQFAIKPDYSVEQRQALAWLQDHFHTALQRGEMQRWLNDILQALDIDLVLKLASRGSIVAE